MKVRFWINNRMIDRPVLVESPRNYVVELDRKIIQVPKHSATLILEEAIKNDNSL